MRLRRRATESTFDVSAVDPLRAAAWEGLPMVAAARVVIRAARAADLAAPAEPMQLA